MPKEFTHRTADNATLEALNDLAKRFVLVVADSLERNGMGHLEIVVLLGSGTDYGMGTTLGPEEFAAVARSLSPAADEGARAYGKKHGD